jgi:energy-coupling factor transport system substrate-specific component
MMTVAVWTALAALVISVPLNMLFYGGNTGNLWGDGVIGFLRERGVPLVACQILGQFYVEFLDKLLTLALLLVTIRLVRRLRGHGGPDRPAQEPLAAALVVALALGMALTGGAARAENDATDYNDYVQTVYNSNNGLPCGEANDIAQTNDGILWIGTYAGLYRYNGREFTWMDNYESVRNVNCLYVDQEGRLWIGTNDNGLSIVIREKVVNVLDQSSGLPSNSVRCITHASDGYYYVGTTGSMQMPMWMNAK